MFFSDGSCERLTKDIQSLFHPQKLFRSLPRVVRVGQVEMQPQNLSRGQLVDGSLMLRREFCLHTLNGRFAFALAPTCEVDLSVVGVELLDVLITKTRAIGKVFIMQCTTKDNCLYSLATRNNRDLPAQV